MIFADYAIARVFSAIDTVICIYTRGTVGFQRSLASAARSESSPLLASNKILTCPPKFLFYTARDREFYSGKTREKDVLYYSPNTSGRVINRFVRR